MSPFWRRGASATPVEDEPQTRLREIGDIAVARERARLDAEIAAAGQNHRFRKLYALGMFSAVILQLGIADGVVIAYLCGAGRPEGEAVNPHVIEVFLGSTVVQVIAVVAVITKHLFPEAKP